LKHVFHKIFSEIFFKNWFEETIIFEKLKGLEKFLAIFVEFPQCGYYLTDPVWK